MNIATILKDKPKNTKLYSSIFGDMYFSGVEDNIIKVIHQGQIVIFFDNGRYYNYPESEPLLFPSKEMRDWEKFTWKKDDVLVNSSGFKLFFDRWANDDYTRFFGKVNLLENSFSYETEKYTLASKDENLDTLEIEKPKFKNGDIVVAEEDNYYDKVIFIATIKDDIVSKALINAKYEDYGVYYNEYRFGHNRSLRLATDSEKQQLFEALANKGKAWDAEKKKVVDLPKKCEFKPFDKCVWKIQGIEGSIWQASFVSYVDKYGATPMGMSIDDLSNLIVLPYNKKTAHLLATTDDWEGGEQ